MCWIQASQDPGSLWLPLTCLWTHFCTGKYTYVCCCNWHWRSSATSLHMWLLLNGHVINNSVSACGHTSKYTLWVKVSDVYSVSLERNALCKYVFLPPVCSGLKYTALWIWGEDSTTRQVACQMWIPTSVFERQKYFLLCLVSRPKQLHISRQEFTNFQQALSNLESCLWPRVYLPMPCLRFSVPSQRSTFSFQFWSKVYT